MNDLQKKVLKAPLQKEWGKQSIARDGETKH